MDVEVRKVLGRGVEGFLGGRDGVCKFSFGVLWLLAAIVLDEIYDSYERKKKPRVVTFGFRDMVFLYRWYFFYYKGYSVSHIFFHTYEKDCFWLKQTKYDYLRLHTSSSAYSLCNLSFKIRKVKLAFLTLHSLIHDSTYRFWITPSGTKASLSLSYNTISFLYPPETPKPNIQSPTYKS